MTPDGELEDPKEYDFSEHENLKKFYLYEESKSRTVEKTPPHVDLMRRLELVDYEPASDPGNLRYYPKGRMIKALLEEYVTEKVLDYGAMEVETPIMYDYHHPTLEKYLNRFPARQYTIESDKKNYFLRFAACFGQFLMAHDATLSYRNLPLRLYEMTRYSFRREQRGELAGLRRLRAFTMPDVHAICGGINQAMDEYKKRLDLCIETVEDIGLSRDDVEMAVRVTRDFYEENKGFLKYLVKEYGRPALIEMWDERVFYFKLKYEFNFVDALDRASCLSTDQIDVENGERYEIEYTDSDGESRHPLILHCSPSGAIERVMYALLEKAAMQMERGEKPMLPLWLSPTQVRIVPVSDEHTGYARELADELEDSSIRVDIDDRSESIGKKIRGAEKEWVPYTVVVGDKEKESGKLSVRIREKDQQEEMVLEALIQKIQEQVEDKPYRPLPSPRMLTKRPTFTG